MPARVFSTLMYAALGIGVGTTGNIRPAAGLLWIVRVVDVYSNGGLGGSEIFMQDDATGGAIFVASVAAGSKNSYHLDTRQVFYSNEGFNFHVTSGSWDVRVSGYALAT